MDSADFNRVKQRARRGYELGRVRRAVLGVSPAVFVVFIAVLIANRPLAVLCFGGAMLACGVGFLWYGRELRKGVLPGFVAGLVPLTLATGVNRWGHICTDDGCLMLCVPACVCGGLLAGLGVSAIGRRKGLGFQFWIASASMAFLTGAMGCMCVGYSGVIGLGVGLATGAVVLVPRAAAHPTA